MSDANKEWARRLITTLSALGVLKPCEACNGRGDRHVESAAYSGQATCPDCGGTKLHATTELYRAIEQGLSNAGARTKNVNAWAQNQLRIMSEMAEDRGLAWVVNESDRIRKGLEKP